MNATTAARHILSGSSFFRPARFCLQALLDRDAIRRRAQRKGFYREIVGPSDLVYDVGANLGHHTETFLSLGARVVAVEPDPRNLTILRNRFQGRIAIEPCALGASEGSAVLYLAKAERANRSSLHQDWVGELCTANVTVPVRTVDSLMAQYGVPHYVKVDTEGHDYDVLRGMSFRPPWVSFEFVPFDLTPALSAAKLLAGYEFNVIVEDQFCFETDWSSNDEVLRETLERLCQSQSEGQIGWGDIIARQVGI